MKKVVESLKSLQNHKEFSKWKKAHPDSFLCHCFKMYDDPNKDEWQIGYYNPDDKITTFIVAENSVKVMEESEVFKKPGTKVNQLNIDDIKCDEQTALETAKDIVKKKYPNEMISKEILIIQNLEIGSVFNITFVTKSLNTINIKIDTITKKILEDRITSLMDFTVDKK